MWAKKFQYFTERWIDREISFDRAEPQKISTAHYQPYTKQKFHSIRNWNTIISKNSRKIQCSQVI